MKDKSAMTLDRLLSRFGLAARGEARKIIAAGRLKVNGRTVRDPNLWVRADADTFHLDGKKLRPARKVYFAFYKPKGVITSHGDPVGRKTVYDCLGPAFRWVSPVGRLDKDTSGLLLLTNDTEFANFVTDPESGVLKTYLVKLNGILDQEKLSLLSSGIRMRRGDWARPESVRRVEDRGRYSRLEVVLSEGKNREVRRMMEAAGYQVLKLVRTRIGDLGLEGMQVGQVRELARADLRRITANRLATIPCE